MSVSKNHFLQVRIQTSFILKMERESPGSGSEPGGDVFISSFPQSFTGEPSQEVFCELKQVFWLSAQYLGGCDNPRQHIKKQRHPFADKSPSSQNYGFSSSHVWM